MQKIVGAVVLALSLFGAGQAMAQGNWYGSVSGGYVMPESSDATVQGLEVEGDYEDGFAVFGAIGYAFGSGIRLEAEIGYASFGYESISVGGTKFDVSGDIDLYTGTVNAFYDIKTGTAFTPYVGVGGGVAYGESSNVSVAGIRLEGDDSTDPMVLGELGVKYAFTPTVSLGVAYRYNHIFNGEDDGFDDAAAHLFKASLTFSF